MTEKQLIKYYKGEMEDYEKKYGKNEKSEICKLTVDFLEEHKQYRSIGTVERCREAVEKQITQPKINKWIPCSERLPEDEKEVFVWFEYFRYGNYNRLFQTYGISYTYKNEWSGFVNGSSGWRDLNVIAWQPLPEPYEP